ALGRRPLCSNQKDASPSHMRFVSPKVVHHRRPVDQGWRLLLYAVIVDVPSDSYDFPPWIFHSLAKPLAQRKSRIAPHLSRQSFGNDRDVAFLVKIGPAEIAARDQRGTGRLKETRRDEPKPADGGNLPRDVALILRVKKIVGVEAFKRSSVGECNR